MDMTPQQAAKLTEQLIAALTEKVESLTAEKGRTLPDCMVPDGGNGACQAYLNLEAALMSKDARISKLTAEKEALEKENLQLARENAQIASRRTSVIAATYALLVKRSEQADSSLAQAREEVERLKNQITNGEHLSLHQCDECGMLSRAEAAEQREKGLRAALADMFDPLQHRVACQKRLMDKCMCAACITERAKAALAAASKEGANG